MRPFAIALPAVLLLGGCTFNTTVDHIDGAPNVPRSDSVAVVSVSPRDAIPLGTVTVRGNRNMAGPACQAEAVAQARRMGATHIIVTPVENSAGRGVRCTAQALYLGKIVQSTGRG